MSKSKWLVLSGLVIAGVLSRWLPHPPNFSPIMALALFAGAFFTQKKWAMAIPVVALLISDLVLGFYNTIWSVYLVFAVATWMAHRSEKTPNGQLSVGRLTVLGIESSVLFFVITNFAVWAQSGMYARTFEGLVACYVAAIPFFQNSLLGNAFYITAFFGGYALLSRAIEKQPLQA